MSEFSDSPDILLSKLEELKKRFQEAKNIVVYTGAGISTAAHIPDYKGENGLESNPQPLVVIGMKEQFELDFVFPTFSHIAIAHLLENECVNAIVTSNHDGLHEKASRGLFNKTDFTKIADIFGCIYVEVCTKCQKYWRRSVVTPILNRSCDDPKCGGTLKKTGVRYGQTVPAEPLFRATQFAKGADLALILGSSLSTYPFAELPFLASSVVLVNRQKTPCDADCDLVIHAHCDEVIRYLIEEAGVLGNGIEIARDFTLSQKYVIQADINKEDDCIVVTITGEVPQEPPSCIESAEIAIGGDDGVRRSEMQKSMKTGEFSVQIPLREVESYPFEFEVVVSYLEATGRDEILERVSVVLSDGNVDRIAVSKDLRMSKSI